MLKRCNICKKIFCKCKKFECVWCRKEFKSFVTLSSGYDHSRTGSQTECPHCRGLNPNNGGKWKLNVISVVFLPKFLISRDIDLEDVLDAVEH